MTSVFHRTSTYQPPPAVGGDGMYLIDKSGKRYLDASAGAAVSCLGHQHPAVIGAIKNQLDKIAFAHTGFFTSEPAEELADMLASRAPGALNKTYFVSGGSEAIESALKLARQYFLESGQPERHKIIARRQSFHGNSLGALAVGGNEWRRQQFEPLLIEVGRPAKEWVYPIALILLGGLLALHWMKRDGPRDVEGETANV